MVELLSDQEHQALASTFAAMDKNGDNLITISEFREAMMKKDPNLDDSKVLTLFSSTVCSLTLSAVTNFVEGSGWRWFHLLSRTGVGIGAQQIDCS